MHSHGIALQCGKPVKISMNILNYIIITASKKIGLSGSLKNYLVLFNVVFHGLLVVPRHQSLEKDEEKTCVWI